MKSRKATMDKSSLSQLLDGAAFPVIMLGVAVSQIQVGPNRKDALRHGGRVTAELQMGDRAQPNAEEHGSYNATWSPPVAEKSVANKKAAHAK
jgi:hypothetical protein